MTDPIDFVITWVDHTDPAWKAKKAEYDGTGAAEGNTEARYRDWDTLKYWFRGVEKFAPWVRYIYFVTDDQKPVWLNTAHPKLRWVKHRDFIPQEYLPTFNSVAIEWNLHRIEGLSEHFVYFNDDVFLIRETTPEDFFVDGQACDAPKLGAITGNDVFSRTMRNNAALINRNFACKEVIKTHWRKWSRNQRISDAVKLLLYGWRDNMPGSMNPHIHQAYQKKYFQILWEREYEVIHQTCKHRLRDAADVTAYCVRDWQLFCGAFHSKKPIGRMFHTASMAYSSEPMEYLTKQKGKVICLNDGEDETAFEQHKQMVIAAFEGLLPERSSFEIQ